MRLAAVALCGASMFVLAVAAKAQSNDTPGSNAGGDKEIIVQAQRRSERLQDVPITITNLSSQKLKDTNVKSLSDVVQLTPALRFDYQGSFAQPTIRGVSTEITGTGSGSNVGIYVDGFYVVSPLASDFQLLNVSNVEVLKGPQGTLFGRNTNGGAVLVTTSQPSHDTHGVLEAQYGSYNARQVSFYGTTGLGDRAAVDFAAIYSGGDGYTTNIINGDKKVGAYTNWTVRAGLLVNVTNDLTMLLRYTHSAENDPTNDLLNSYVINGIPQTIGFVIPGSVITSKPNTVSIGFPVSSHTETDTLQLTVTDDLHFAKLTSYSQFALEHDDDFTSLSDVGPFDAFHTRFIVPQHMITQEFLLNSEHGGPLQWTTGVFYFDQIEKLTALGAAGPVPPVAFAGGSETEYMSFAVYGQVTYRLMDRLYLTGGLRYSHDIGIHLFNVTVASGSKPIPNITGDTVIPRAVIRYELTNASNVYFSFSQGYKAAIPDLGAAIPTPVKPENLTAYEVGFKYSSGPLRADFAAYYYDWKNIQVTNLIDHNGATLQNTTNAAQATIYGVEGQVSYDITPDFNVNVSAAYTHGRYGKFDGNPTYNQCLSVACAGPGFGNFGLLVSGFTNQPGLSLPRTPEITATFGARYTHELAGGELALSGNLYYSSKVFFDSSNQTSQGSFENLSLRAEWTDPSKRYTIAVFGNNVTNDHYRTQVLESNLGMGQEWSAPATIGGSVRVNFH